VEPLEGRDAFKESGMKASNFTKWLLKQAKRDDIIGDLARDAKADKELDGVNTFEEWEVHLFVRRASPEVKDALQQAIAEYVLQ
jgi:hypothetical protein